MNPATEVVCFCLGYLCVMLSCCYFKLCDIERHLRPKHN